LILIPCRTVQKAGWFGGDSGRSVSGAHEPEIETLATLRNALPDDYTVFHGVHWTRQYKGRALYGEIDFVVINNAGRVLCIEQKNGGLEESEGGLLKDCGDERKSVRDPILRSVDSIREKFSYVARKKPGLVCTCYDISRTTFYRLLRGEYVEGNLA
jgi:hypothetical protein